ncbi:TPA: DUF262 domain-containing protein [Aeromonas dhakensis]|nr:DUF262 domain-containing protein [Aeromonas dhakensis]
MSTILEQYRISDFVSWHESKQLILSPSFQRGQVWKPAARIFLIDTILRGLPIPKIYMRTIIDRARKTSVREVIDGQQRMRAILDFVNDKIVLSSRAGEFSGYKFSTLPDNLQDQFLAYPLAVDQLLNASNDEVLEVFARLNSYTVTLNSAEKRHAKYQGEFKWAVRKSSKRWAVLWDEYKVLSTRERVRMLDDSLVSEMFGIILEGVKDGGQTNIDKLYSRYDDNFDGEEDVVNKVDEAIEFIIDNFADDLADTFLMQGPHFLMLFAAIAHGLFEIDIDGYQGIPETADMLNDIDTCREKLLLLVSAFEEEPANVPEALKPFIQASKSSTHRISSREERFRVLCNALAD